MWLIITILMIILYAKCLYDSLIKFYETDSFIDYLFAMTFFFLIIASLDVIFTGACNEYWR